MARRIKKSADLRRNVVDLAWYGDEFMDIVEKSTPEGLFAGGTVILETARGRAPHRSGTLAKSGFVLAYRKDNYVKGPADRKNIQKIMATVHRPDAVMVAFAAWYSNLFEDSGRKKNVAPRAMRKRGGSSVRRAKGELKSGRLKIQSALKIPGIGYRARVTIPRMRARPFLADAVESTKTQFVQALSDVMRKDLEGGMPA